MEQMENTYPLALLDANNVCLNVIVVLENATQDDFVLFANAYNAKSVVSCKNMFHYGIGMVWNGSSFEDPNKPYPSWIWDSSIMEYVAPVTKPAPTVGTTFEWNEEMQKWESIQI